MTRKKRTVANRQKSLEPVTPKANSTLAWVRKGYEAIGGKEFHCTIRGYCRTQVSEDRFPPGRRRASPHDLFISFCSSVCRFKFGGLLRELAE